MIKIEENILNLLRKILGNADIASVQFCSHLEFGKEPS